MNKRDKTAQMMQDSSGQHWGTEAHFQRFAALIRADERERLLTGVEMPEPDGMDNDDTAYFTAEQLRETVAAAVAREREVCAKVCEELGMATNGMYERNHECATAIRARGNT